MARALVNLGHMTVWNPVRGMIGWRNTGCQPRTWPTASTIRFNPYQDIPQSVLQVMNRASRDLQSTERITVGVTSPKDGRPCGCDEILRRRYEGLGAPHVLEKPQPPSWLQDTPQLPKSLCRLADSAEDQGGDDLIEGGIGEREGLGPGPHQEDRGGAMQSTTSGPTQHRRVRIDGDHKARSLIEVKVQPGSHTDVQHPSLRGRDHLAA